MSEVRIKWLQRVAGRDEGDVEVVELTPFIEGCVENNRLEIVEHMAPDLAPGVSIPEPRLPRQRRTEE